VPAIVAAAGRRASRRFVEFFTANIQNQNTREAYARAINAFLSWCENEADTALDMLEPVIIAAYVEKLLKKERRNVEAHGQAASGRDPDDVLTGW
jgi:site-specific recombinase XerD